MNHIQKPKRSLSASIIKVFDSLEMVIAVVLSAVIIIIALLALITIFKMTYEIIVSTFNASAEVSFTEYTRLFARIITLLISLEFMNSILKIIKSRNIKVLASDVVLITVLAICRKLIVVDYHEYEVLYFFAFALILLCLGVLYAMINYRFQNKHQRQRSGSPKKASSNF